MSELEFDQQQQNLAYELEALSRLIRHHLATEKNDSVQTDVDAIAEHVHEGTDRVLAMARLCRDLPLSDWQELIEQLGFKQWIAFPLNGDIFPYLMHLQERLEDLAVQVEQDPLTGLFNRRAYDRLLLQEMERSKRQNSYLSLAVLDLDDFKQVNDTYGHPAGDTVLIGLAKAMRETKRAYDLAARIGGEEFALILPGTGGHKCKAMLQRVLDLFSSMQFTHEGKTFSCTFSAGVSSFRGRAQVDSQTFHALADKALYEAKKEKNRIIVQRVTEEPVFPKATMVHMDEKQFLFSG